MVSAAVLRGLVAPPIRHAHQRRGAGAVDRGGLENRCTPRGYPGFESLPLRQTFTPRRLNAEPAGTLGKLPNSAHRCRAIRRWCLLATKPKPSGMSVFRETSHRHYYAL